MIRTLLKPFSFVPALLLMYMIYSFSAQPGEVSSQLSYKVSYKIVETVDQTLNAGMADWEIETWVYRIHGLVRKLAHMTEYFALAVAVSFPLYVYGVHGIWLMLLAGFICVGFACGDEYHQSFVEGRGPSVRDVAIDSFGVFWGIILVRIVGWTGRKTIFRPRKKKKKKEAEPQMQARSGQAWQEPRMQARSGQMWQEPRMQGQMPPVQRSRQGYAGQGYTGSAPQSGQPQGYAGQHWQQAQPMQDYDNPAPQNEQSQAQQSWQQAQQTQDRQVQEYARQNQQQMQPTQDGQVREYARQNQQQMQPTQDHDGFAPENVQQPTGYPEYVRQKVRMHETSPIQSTDETFQPQTQASQTDYQPQQTQASQTDYQPQQTQASQTDYSPHMPFSDAQDSRSVEEQGIPVNVPYRPYTRSYQYDDQIPESRNK